MSNLVQLIIQFRNCLPMGENRGNQTGRLFWATSNTVLRCVLCAPAYNAHLIFEVRSGGKSLVPIYNTRYFRDIGFTVT